MNSIRKLVELKVKKSPNKDISEAIPDSKSKETFYNTGRSDSIEANGDPTVLSSCLEDNYEKFKDKCRKDDDKQRQLNEPYIQQQAEKRSELKKRETLKAVKIEERSKLNKEIISIDNEISSVRTNPKDYGLDELSDLIEYGASPRASIYLYRCAKVEAFFEGRSYVVPDDVKAVVYDILASVPHFS